MEKQGYNRSEQVSEYKYTEEVVDQECEVFIELSTKGRRSKPFMQKEKMNDCDLFYLIYRKYLFVITSVFKDNNSVYLRNIYIKPEYRNQSIGKKLLMNLFYDLFNDGIFQVEIEPFESAVEYWEKWGFNFTDNLKTRMYLDLHKLKNLRSYNDFPRIYLMSKRME